MFLLYNNPITLDNRCVMGKDEVCYKNQVSYSLDKRSLYVFKIYWSFH